MNKQGLYSSVQMDSKELEQVGELANLCNKKATDYYEQNTVK
ncbi:hypothetical protein [Paenibacillus oryzae]|nr:hypothetical protein [Paenibacillus oryzae]